MTVLDDVVILRDNEPSAPSPASSASTGEWRVLACSFVPLRDITGRVVAVSLVDADLAPALNRWSWHLNTYGYAVRCERLPGGHQRQLFLHRVVMGCCTGDGMEIDHISRDKLDNRRANLRFVTHVENVANSDKQRSPYGDSQRARRRSGARGMRLCRNHLHEMTPENTRVATSTDHRRCQACVDAYRRPS